MKNFLLILLLALLFSNVFFINTSVNFIGDGGDNYEYFGFMNLAKNNLLQLKHPFSETNILRYPQGFDFAYGFDGVFAIITGALLSLITNPILAYNLTIVLILFANIFISYYAFIKLGQIYEAMENLKLKSLISALIFGASPFVFARLNGHLNLSFVAGFPLLLVYILNLNKKITQNLAQIEQKDINLIALGVLLVSFGSLQYIILLAFTAPLFVLYFLRKDKLSKYSLFVKNHYAKIIISLVYFSLVFLIVFGGYVTAIITGNIVYVEAIQKFFRPHILDLVMPNRYLGDLWAFLNPSERSIERVITVGTLELGLFVYILATIKDKKLGLFGMLFFTLYMVLSFGWLRIPFYPEGGRITVLFSLFIAVLIIIRKDFIKDPIISSLFLTIIIVERLFFNLEVNYPLSSDVLKAKVRNLPGEAVLNVPLSKYNTYRSALPVFYEKKVLDGYFHYTAGNPRSEAVLTDELFTRFICLSERTDKPYYIYQGEDRMRLIERLDVMDVQAAVVFKDEIVGQFFNPGCENVRDWWYWLVPETLVLAQDTAGIIKNNFDIIRYNPHSHAQVFFERGGRFVLNGIFITPASFKDLQVFLPDGSVVSPGWQELEDGYSTEFVPPIEVQVKAGDYVRFEGQEKVDTDRYINIYFLFEEDTSTLERKKVPFENIYSDKNVEIYQVNFNK